ncbi:MAG: DUF11 domain-containing protein [Burkholderiales bacterium]|nr:DUF11 domain-containing protein [Burkholderiales bacterium]
MNAGSNRQSCLPIVLSAVLPVDPAVLATILGGIMQSTLRRFWLSVCMGLSALLPQAAPAATFTPTTVAQLISAITTANANGASDIIDLGGLTFILVAVDNGSNALPLVLGDGGNPLTIANGTIARSAFAPAFRLLEVATDASLTLDGVTISGGGAIFNEGTIVHVVNSTFSGNTANSGGAIHNAGDIATITNSTFSGNVAASGGGIHNSIDGNIGELASSIVAGNAAPSGPDIDNQGAMSAAYFNLIGINSGHTITNGVDNNQVGTAVTPLNPLLGPLASNGGPTQTRALLAGSPAINAGANALPLVFDQRGEPYLRNFGGQTDIGAYEVQPVADVSVTKVDTPDPVTAGTNLAYAITIDNAGPSDADSVSLSDTLPAGTTFVSLAAPVGWSCTTPAVGAGGNVSCSIATLAPGTAVFTLTVAVGPSVSAAPPEPSFRIRRARPRPRRIRLPATRARPRRPLYSRRRWSAAPRPWSGRRWCAAT